MLETIVPLVLVVHTDQIVCQLLYHISRVWRLDRIWMMPDEHGLCSLDNDDAFFALWKDLQHGSRSSYGTEHAYLLPVKTSVIGFQHNESLSGNVNAFALNMFDAILVSLVLERGDDLF